MQLRTLLPPVGLSLVLALSAWSCRPAAPSRPPPPALQSPNPFGVMLPPALARSPKAMVQVAQDLGVAYLRPEAIFLDRWDGSCPPCEAALQGGLGLVLTVRNGGGPSPSMPPSDLDAYRQRLGRVLDRYRPALLVVENEENSALFYSGSPEQYGQELRAACQVAHQRGIPCTNGGLVSSLVALLVYQHYLERGQADAARSFAARAFDPRQREELGSALARQQLEKGRALLAQYRAAGADYVNFHWYIADAAALGEAVAYLREATGLPVVCNEMGQHNDDPRVTTALMEQALSLGLPIVVWFGLDGPQARGLMEPDGTLRPTGEAFRGFLHKRFS